MKGYSDKATASNKLPWRIWWGIIRPESLPVSIIPVLIGTIFGVADNAFHIWLFLAVLIASVLIHLGANIFNEYYDYKRGVDDEESVGTGGALVRGDIKPKAALCAALIFFFIAMLLGIYISVESSWWIALIGSVSMLVGYFYTGGPLPIAYTPFGELFSGLFMGTVIIGVSYFIQTLTITGDVILISIPVTLFVSSIMLTNNIRDLESDKENGRKTLAILLGRTKAIRFLGLLFIISFILTALYIIFNMLPIFSLIIFLAAFKAYDVIKKIRAKTQPAEMMPAMAAVGQTHAIYGALLALTVFIHILL